jgi:phosphonate metabolism protein PhnN/1,5-bisphosphokinase (PRPP-forming)
MKIVLVVGPSGSGKDTLLRSARKYFAGKSFIAFARRYITRPPDENEDNYYVDTIGFDHLQRSGFFLSTWQAHQNYYGIAEHMVGEHHGYSTIVCSISRSAIKDFDSRYENTLTVHVTAEKDILKERLLKRGREKMTDIERRLARAEKKVEARNLLTFDNSHDLEKNCALFSSLLQHVDSRDEMPNKICTFNFI